MINDGLFIKHPPVLMIKKTKTLLKVMYSKPHWVLYVILINDVKKVLFPILKIYRDILSEFKPSQAQFINKIYCLFIITSYNNNSIQASYYKKCTINNKLQHHNYRGWLHCFSQSPCCCTYLVLS